MVQPEVLSWDRVIQTVQPLGQVEEETEEEAEAEAEAKAGQGKGEEAGGAEEVEEAQAGWLKHRGRKCSSEFSRLQHRQAHLYLHVTHSCNLDKKIFPRCSSGFLGTHIIHSAKTLGMCHSWL